MTIFSLEVIVKILLLETTRVNISLQIRVDSDCESIHSKIQSVEFTRSNNSNSSDSAVTLLF